LNAEKDLLKTFSLEMKFMSNHDWQHEKTGQNLLEELLSSRSTGPVQAARRASSTVSFTLVFLFAEHSMNRFAKILRAKASPSSVVTSGFPRPPPSRRSIFVAGVRRRRLNEIIELKESKASLLTHKYKWNWPMLDVFQLWDPLRSDILEGRSIFNAVAEDECFCLLVK
jgi:hypothetical protein